MTTRFALTLAFGTAAIFTVTSAARAQNDSAGARAFAEGRSLMDAGRIAEACPKLEESARLAPNGKVILNLAECYERNGQTASAHERFLEAAARAGAAHRDDIEKLARDRARTLEGRLSTLAVVVQRRTPGLEIRRDGKAIPETSWGLALAVDPGLHHVEASAPGRRPWSFDAHVGAAHNAVVVTVPELSTESSASPPATSGAAAERPSAPVDAAPASSRAGATAPAPNAQADVSSSGGSSRRTIGFVVGGIGVAGVATGVVFAVLAKSKHDGVAAACPDNHCPSEGVRAAQLGANDTSRTFVWVGSIAMLAGVAAITTGAVLIIGAPSSKSSSAAWTLAPTVGGASLWRSW